jgi:hypothetical protein
VVLVRAASSRDFCACRRSVHPFGAAWNDGMAWSGLACLVRPHPTVHCYYTNTLDARRHLTHQVLTMLRICLSAPVRATISGPTENDLAIGVEQTPLT